MLLGAIDVGTNSIHLIVVELDPRFGTSRTLLKAREMVRLGAGDGLQRGFLGKKAVLRGVAAIEKFARTARAAGASEIVAVATSAVREAANRDEFLAAVKASSGVDVTVLSETEEARLIHLGVSRGFPLYDRVACVMDIGGGSTEFIIADQERPFFLHSVKLGSLRLYEEFLADGPAGLRAYRAMRERIGEVLEPVTRQLLDYRFDTMIGTSGTVMGLAALDAAAASVPSQRAHGYRLRRERLIALQDEMWRKTPAERKKMPGMNPRRSDIIVAGNAIVIAAMEALGQEELVVCEHALRDGVVVDYLERNAAVARKIGGVQLRRFDSARELARRFGSEGVHENRVGALAVELFDRLRGVHTFEPAERDMLFAAALVHDVGRAVNASAHHKHGAYIVQNAQPVGFSSKEISLMSALVRYHRKALPKPTHPEWANADDATKAQIEGLGGILRLADGLDARHLAVVDSVEVRREGSAIELRVHAQQDIAPEIAAAQFKSDLFTRAFGLAVRVSAAPRERYAEAESEPSAEEMSSVSSAG
ncbi:MAG TPA: Ppx/GppA phosphatase family protein [Candidatus Acidoferrales bacterium]|nr:Ppx/GppA phosphatase family protein [Candidatus Acidoferrales bacterium]